MPPKIYTDKALYSRKVFLGGLPWDVNQPALLQMLNKYGPVKLEIPGKDQKHPRVSNICKTQERSTPGYVYIIYESESAVQRMLASGGGAIVNVVSAAGNSGAVAGAAYTSTKHGLLGLTRNTAWMYARQGIRCNAILPGGVSTSIVSGTDPQQWDSAGTERVRTFLATMPTMLEPLDIARLALFLAGDESRHVNGAAVTADGGWLAT